MAREINLVPDVKGEMIKALKLRNYILFLSIIVAAAGVGVTAIAGLVMGGQQLIVDSKEQTIQNLSAKLNSYSDLNDFLTIKDQLGNISTLTSNKKVLSRTFNILSTLLPTGADTITISELSVNLSGEAPTFTFDAQANAKTAPFIDYNVLDAFKKSMAFMRYDYGQYVDKNGNTIPAYCMIETGQDGSMFNDPERGIYAYWTIHAEGCNPAQTSDADTSDASNAYPEESYANQNVVRIWRTPQFSDWYKTKEVEGQPYMSLDGTISNVPHFVSACITYSGDDSKDSANPKWTEANEQCLLVQNNQSDSEKPTNDEPTGIKVSDSSNGRSEGNELVLRFSAVITLNPETYNFNNTHMMAIPPSGRRNVTDSYVQIQAMFSERAVDCAEDDTSCSDTPINGDSASQDQDNSDSSNSNNNSSSERNQNG